MSFGLNGSVMTADHAQLASYLENFPAGRIDGAAVVLGTLFFQRLAIPYKMNVTEADLVMLVSNSANAAGSHTMNLALYTISNTSKAVMASSTSRTFAYNSTLAASSYTHVSGTRYRSFDAPWAITPGDYLLAVGVSLSTGLTSGTYSVYGANIPQIRAEEFAGGDHLRYFGRGAFSAATNGIPASVHISDINQTGGANIGAMPWIQFIGT